MNRRYFVATSAATFIASSLDAPAQTTPPQSEPRGPFTLAPLPFAEDALEPHIDTATMKLHHGAHHRAYVINLNKALLTQTEHSKKSLDELIGGIPFLPADLQKVVQNHGGGHWNHTFFWEGMSPQSGSAETEAPTLHAAILKAFTSWDAFKTKFSEAGMKRFGSGWAWLILRPDGSLMVTSTANQDNPLMQGIVPHGESGTPLLGLDVWEHAYYLKHQQKRADYISAWWQIINWQQAEKNWLAAKSKSGTK